MKKKREVILSIGLGILIALVQRNCVQAQEYNIFNKNNSRTKKIELTQAENDIIPVTGITINQTSTGLELVLETPQGQQLRSLIFPDENQIIIEIINGRLELPNQEEFEIQDPRAGIQEITVSQLDETTIEIIITGDQNTPTADLVFSESNFVLSVNPNITEDPTIPPDNQQIEPGDETIELVVTAEGQNPLIVDEPDSVFRGEIPLRDVPRSIQLIPSEIFENKREDLGDALRSVSGAVQGSRDPRGQRFVLRGFSDASVLRDGFRQTFGGDGNFGFPELANIETIEVLKGPASIFFGVVEPGGVINLVTKKPESDPFFEYQTDLGNQELISPQIDITGPLNDDASLRYRLITLYRSEESFRNFEVDDERFFIAPSIAVDITDRTELTVTFEYSDEEAASDFGIVAIGDEVANIPIDTVIGDPEDTTFTEFLRAGYNLEHEFNDKWKLRNTFYFTRFDTNFFSASALLNTIFEDTGDILLFPFNLDQPSDNFELQTNVIGEFNTGKIEHKIVFGVDLNRRNTFENVGLANVDPTAPAFGATFFNIFDPNFEDIPSFNPETALVVTDTDVQVDRLGIFIQDQITIFDNLKFLAAVRYDTVEQETITNPSFANGFSDTTVATQDDDAFSPQFGLVYQPIEEVSIYTSFSRSFVPNTGITVDGSILEPERGEQFELGTRAFLFDGNFSVNVAYFIITKDNVAASDPDSVPPGLFVVPEGTQQSEGFELDIIGEILPGWNLILNYALTDADIVSGDNEGNRLFNAPRSIVNASTSYQIQKGSLEGLGFDIGINYVSNRFGDNANSFVVDPYFLVNGGIFYEKDNWRASVNFRNLFDVDFIEGTDNSRTTEVSPGEGFTVIGTIRIEL